MSQAVLSPSCPAYLRLQPREASAYNIQLTCTRLVDEVVKEANRHQNRERVCLAFETYRRQDTGGDSFTIMFFSIREEEVPVSFTDCMGRKMTIPFETCRTWEVSLFPATGSRLLRSLKNTVSDHSAGDEGPY